MRKTAAFFLLCVYIIVQAASVCWYFYKPLAHAYFVEQSKHDFEESDGDVTIITIDKDKLAQLKNDEDEVVIDGVLYDIENAISSGATVKLFLKMDSDETDWNIQYKRIDAVLHQGISDGHTNQGKISFSMIPFFYHKEATTDIFFIKQFPKTDIQISTHFYTWPLKEMTTPPPKFC